MSVPTNIDSLNAMSPMPQTGMTQPLPPPPGSTGREPPKTDSAMNVEQVTGHYPQGDQTGAILLITALSGLVPVRIIDPSESVQPTKKYYIIITNPTLNTRRIGVEIPQQEYNTLIKKAQATAAAAAATKGVHQPGVRQPGVPQPDVRQPGVPQPGVPQPGVGEPELIGGETAGDALEDLYGGVWEMLMKSEMQPNSFGWMMATLCVGVIIGSIYRIGWCRIPGLNGSYCNYATLMLIAIFVLLLAVMSKNREPEDFEKDLFDYWQTWAMIVAIVIIGIVGVSFAFRKSGITAFGDFGGSSGMYGMPGMSPGMSGYM